MPINKPQGLQGLQGLGSLSKAQYDSFINKNRDLISQHGYDPVYINNLYSNKQFIDKYGIEKFKAIPDIDMRNTLYKMILLILNLLNYIVLLILMVLGITKKA